MARHRETQRSPEAPRVVGAGQERSGGEVLVAGGERAPLPLLALSRRQGVRCLNPPAQSEEGASPSPLALRWAVAISCNYACELFVAPRNVGGGEEDGGGDGALVCNN